MDARLTEAQEARNDQNNVSVDWTSGVTKCRSTTALEFWMFLHQQRFSLRILRHGGFRFRYQPKNRVTWKEASSQLQPTRWLVTVARELTSLGCSKERLAQARSQLVDLLDTDDERTNMQVRLL